MKENERIENCGFQGIPRENIIWRKIYYQ